MNKTKRGNLVDVRRLSPSENLMIHKSIHLLLLLVSQTLTNIEMDTRVPAKPSIQNSIINGPLFYLFFF